MEIIEKILTGNLGYGTVVLIVMLFIGVYQTFIVPKLNKADELEEKKDKKISELEAQCNSKDELVANNIDTIQKQQDVIEELTRANADSLESIKSLSDSTELVRTVTDLNRELERFVEKYSKDNLEIRQELKQTDVNLERLRDNIETKIEPLIKKYSEETGESVETVLKALRENNAQRYTEQSQLSMSISNVLTEVSDLKSIVSAQLNSRLQNSRYDNDVMQDLK